MKKKKLIKLFIEIHKEKYKQASYKEENEVLKNDINELKLQLEAKEKHYKIALQDMHDMHTEEIHKLKENK